MLDHIRDAIARRRFTQKSLANATVEAERLGRGRAVTQKALSGLLGTEPRRLTIDQVVALAAALRIEVSDLLQSPAAVREREAWELFGQAVDLRNDIRNKEQLYEEAIYKVRRRVAASLELRRQIEDYREQVEENFEAALHRQSHVDGHATSPDDVFRNLPPAALAARDALNEREAR